MQQMMVHQSVILPIIQQNQDSKRREPRAIATTMTTLDQDEYQHFSTPDYFEDDTSTVHNLFGKDDRAEVLSGLTATEIYIIIGSVGGFIVLCLLIAILYLTFFRKVCRKGEVILPNGQERPPQRFDIVRAAQVPDVVIEGAKQSEDGLSTIGNDLPTLQIRGRPRAEIAADPSYRNSFFLNPADLAINLPYSRMPPELQLGLPITTAAHHQRGHSVPVDYDRNNYLNERIADMRAEYKPPNPSQNRNEELMVSLV